MIPPNRTGRDQYYINSTSFEVYMITGLVWLAITTFVFVLSIATNHEPWVWPGGILAVVVAAIVLRVLSRRERNAKIREVDGE
jgi:uncharacterized membrane protein YdbT with pleckstrin-like domain